MRKHQEKKTVIEILEEVAEKWGSKNALNTKKDGKWIGISWQEYRDQVRLYARAFMALGLHPKEAITIIGMNSPQWFISDLAAIYAGAVATGIYTTNNPKQCQYITDHCDASIVVVENEDQLTKFRKVKQQLPKVKAYVLMNGKASDAHSWEDLPQMAQKISEDQLEQRIKAQNPDDTCTIIYSSETTGNPKGAMITHDNLTWTARSIVDTIHADEKEHLVSYLPLSHVAEQVVSLHSSIIMGASVWFAESIENLGYTLREVRPTIFLGVPRVWEKIHAKMVESSAKNPPLRKKIVAWARKKGLAGGYAEQNGKPKPACYGLANKLVFSKVRLKLGLARCRLQITVAAPISKDTIDFFLSLGVPIYEVYGMRECTGPATLSLPTAYHIGKVGKVLPGAEIKIASDGEICMRGRHVFKGYFKDPEATKKTIDEEGWLHSGDIGGIDESGFVQITNRKKDLIITAGCKNIAPQVLEGMLERIPIIGQAVIIGDKRRFVVALITLNMERLPTEATQAGSSAKTVAEAQKCEKLYNYIMQQIEKLNETLPSFQTIRKITIVPAFTIEGGEITPTMHIKRNIINKKFEKEIESMYL